MLLVILFILLTPVSHAKELEVDWREAVRHLTGAGDAQGPRMARILREDPRLTEKLRAALRTPDRFLAMDVITALHRQELLPDLIEISAADSTGYSYLAIAAFIDQKNLSEFSALFSKRLAEPEGAAGAKVILLDMLGRVGAVLPPRLLGDFFTQTNSPEVRSAALSYLRTQLLRKPSVEEVAQLRLALGARELSRQFKMQALFLLSELPPKIQSQVGELPFACPDPEVTRLKKLCGGLRL